MRRKDLVTTTMALTLAVFMSAVSTGCGHQSEIEDTSVAVESVTESTEVAEEGYKIVKVDKEYPAVTTVDCSLLDSADAVTEVSSLTKETYVTVYGDVTYNGVPVDFYAVRLDDGSTGFIDGKNLDFNVALEEDYADSLVEVEEPEETEVVESTEVEETPVENTNLFNIVDCDPVAKYTNTNANIRAIPDKSGELVDTVTTNTELTINGTTEDGSWSRTERNGVVCYIKSSLLSDTKTEVKQPSSSSSSGQSSSSGASSNQSSGQSQSPTNGGTSSDTSQPSQPSTPSPAAGDPNPADFGWDDGYTNAGEVPSGGTTGADNSNSGYGGGY